MGLLNNNKTDPNKFLPIKYLWAREYYKSGVANNWTPDEISMQEDVEQWKSSTVINDLERRLILWNLGFFSTAESLTANNIVLAIYYHISDPACRQYLLRQAYEEAIHCYVEGTEVFTTNGFKDFRNLTPNDLVAQYHEDGSITFVKPRSYYCDDFSGKLISFSNKSETYLSLVTPDHRCVFMDERDDNKIKIKLASELSPCNKKFPVSGKLYNKNSRPFTDWDRLKIAFQADGNIRNKNQKIGKRSGYVVWIFNLKKERKKSRLRELIKNLGLKHKEYKLPQKHGKVDHVKFSVWVPIDEHVKNKDFEWFKFDEISNDWIRNFIKESGHWDGCFRKNKGSICYTSTNKKCIDKIIAIAHLAGYRCGLYEVKVTGNRNQAYQVHLFDKSYCSGKTIKKSEVPYRGKVYCVGVDSGMLLVRYKDKIVVSGNTDTFVYCCDSLGLDPDEIYSMYQTIPSIKKKDDFVVDITKVLFSRDFEIDQPLEPLKGNEGNTELRNREYREKKRLDQIRLFLIDLVGFYVIMEGIFFYAGFAMMLALKRLGHMRGVGEQFDYIMRDEAVHLAFGVDLINTIRQEEPDAWTPELEKEIISLISKAVELEKEYAYDACPEGILGISAEQFCDYVEYVTDRRLERLGIEKKYNKTNPFPWMVQNDLTKEKNFFETKVTEYQVGGLKWD